MTLFDPAEVTKFRSMLETLREENAALKAANGKLAEYIQYGEHKIDNACRQCLPYGTILIEGFVCAWHLAQATPAAQEGQKP